MDPATSVKVVDPKDRGTTPHSASNVPRLENPASWRAARYGLPVNLDGRFIVCSIFSQEKHIFFEQIQPRCVISHSSISFTAPSEAFKNVPQPRNVPYRAELCLLARRNS